MSQMSQEDCIAILFIDCGYSTGAQRRGWLHLHFGKKYADELTTAQKSKAIEQLKTEKELGV